MAGIAYTVYQVGGYSPASETLTPVTGYVGNSLAPTDVLWDTLQTDQLAAGWNFKHCPPLGSSSTASRCREPRTSWPTR